MAGNFWSIGISAQGLTDGTICSRAHRFGDFAIGSYLAARNFGAEVIDAGSEIHKGNGRKRFNWFSLMVVQYATTFKSVAFTQ